MEGSGWSKATAFMGQNRARSYCGEGGGEREECCSVDDSGGGDSEHTPELQKSLPRHVHLGPTL